MNLFIDAYHFFVMAISYIVALPFTEGIIVAFICLFFMRKIGVTKFLWIRMLSLTPVTDKRDKELLKSKRYKVFNDVFYLTLIFLVFVKVPLWGINQKFLFHEDVVNERTDSRYKLERDKWLEVSLMAGLPLFPYVWIPVVIGINKYRQWVDIETMVTWKYHDQRRQCFWSGYEDSSCGYAMDMARALYRDDESLEIGQKFVEASKTNSAYDYCYALGRIQDHAEQVENIEMYKELVKKRCELDCHKSCEDHKYAQILPKDRLKNKFSDRRKLSSFLR